MVHEVTSMESFNFEEITKEGVVVIDFYATWCGPCKMLAPILEDISDVLPDLKIHKFNVDLHRDLALKMEARAIPCLIIFKDGKEVDRKTGYSSKESLLSWFNSVVGEK